MKATFTIILFYLTISVFSQIQLTEINIKNRNKQIVNQLKTDLASELDTLGEFSLSPIPLCNMIVDKKQNISLLLDTIKGFAVLKDQDKKISYASKAIESYPYTRTVINNSTIYIGGHNLRYLDRVALKHSSEPFRIDIYDMGRVVYHFFIGIGFFENGVIYFIDCTKEKPMVFDNLDDFIESRFGSKENFIEQFPELKKEQRKLKLKFEL